MEYRRPSNLTDFIGLIGGDTEYFTDREIKNLGQEVEILSKEGAAPFKSFKLDKETEIQEQLAMIAFMNSYDLLKTPEGKEFIKIPPESSRPLWDFGIPEKLEGPLTGSIAVVNYYLRLMKPKYRAGNYTLEEYKKDLDLMVHFAELGIYKIGLEPIKRNQE